MSEGRPFVIVGAQKSATTTLCSLLGDSPGVYAPAGELMCFDDPYDPVAAAHVITKLAADGGSSRVFGFKRAELLHRPEAPERIAHHLADPTLFAILREPVSRCISAYFHYVRVGLIPLVPIEVGLPGILDHRPEWEGTLGYQIVEWSRYAAALARYRERFGPRFVVLTQDDLRSDPGQVVSAGLSALGLEADDERGAPPTEKNIGVYSLRRLRWLRIASRLVYQHRLGEDHFTVHPSRLRRTFFKASTAVDHALFHDKRASGPVVSAELRERLAELFAPDVLAAEREMGCPLPTWRRAGGAVGPPSTGSYGHLGS